MRQRVRRSTGFLAKQIGMRVSLTRDEYAGTASVGPLKVNYPLVIRQAILPATARKASRARMRVTISAAASVARFLEFGTR
jgi:hypothetical protein